MRFGRRDMLRISFSWHTISGFFSKSWVELVVDQQAYGWSPGKLHFQDPCLRLGQINSALAYSWDHREELDCDVRRCLQWVDGLRRTLSMSKDQRRSPS
jgi:hypothetical protein